MQVVMKNTTLLCSTKPIVTVNGQFPGPTIYAREDDTVLVKVVNHVKYNVSIHWLVLKLVITYLLINNPLKKEERRTKIVDR